MTSALSVAFGLENEVFWQKIHRWMQQLRICSKWWRAWGQLWVPWYQPCGWDALGPCLGLVQGAHCGQSPVPFPHHSHKMGEWNKEMVSAVSKRNITCCGSIFSFLFSLIFFPFLGAILMSGTALSALPNTLGKSLQTKTHMIGVLFPKQGITVYF